MPVTIVESPVGLSEKTRKRIRDMQRGENWNYQGALAIPVSACENAIDFAESVLRKIPGMEQPRIAPSIYGAVSLSWRRGDDRATTEVGPNRDSVDFQVEK